MTNEQYEANERNEAFRRTMEIERAPLSDRREARAEWLEAMKSPALVAERIEWLLDGHYGYGQMVEAKGILGRTRMNREAALCQLIARYEWMCPAKFAAEAWKSLTDAQKADLSVAVINVINNAAKEGV